MDIRLERFSSGDESTLGLLFVNGQWDCFVCEDQRQKGEKIPGETRIPAGVYEIKLRTEGGMHQRYAERFPDMHQGMLWLQNVPNFTYVYLHIGNDDDDTLGCPLVGLNAVSVPGGGGRVGRSVDAYRRFYPRAAGALLRHESVTIEILDRDVL